MSETGSFDVIDICIDFAHSNGACPLWRRLLDRAYAVSVFSWDNLVYLVLGLLVLFASKYLYWLQLAINWRFAGKRDLADELGAHMSSMMSEQQEEVVAAEGEGSAPRRFRAQSGSTSSSSSVTETVEEQNESSSSSSIVNCSTDDAGDDDDDWSSSGGRRPAAITGGVVHVRPAQRGAGVAGGPGEGSGGSQDGGGSGVRRGDGSEANGQVARPGGRLRRGKRRPGPPLPDYPPRLPRKGRCGIDLEDLLVEKDNKAVAMVFAGYMFAIGLVVQSAVEDLQGEPVTDILEVILWTAVGTTFLFVSGLINQFILLSRLVKYTSLVTHSNIAVACVAAGSYVSAGMMVAGAISGPTIWTPDDLLSALLYFILGQLALVVYSVVFIWLNGYNLKKQLQRGNYAAGLHFSASMIAHAMTISMSMERSVELAAFGIWFLMGGVFLFVLRLAAEKFLIWGVSQEDEIVKDWNWGAAALLGAAQISLAMGFNSLLPSICQVSDVVAIWNDRYDI